MTVIQKEWISEISSDNDLLAAELQSCAIRCGHSEATPQPWRLYDDNDNEAISLEK